MPTNLTPRRPEPKVTTVIRLPVQMRAQLAEAAERNGRTLGGEVRFRLRNTMSPADYSVEPVQA